MIHEYIHTLAHSQYTGYINKLPADKSHTFREGMTEVFTKTVWSGVPLGDASLRTRIEGAFHDPKVTHPVPDLSTYDEVANADAVISIIGIRNAYAAYFLGQTKLIGKV